MVQPCGGKMAKKLTRQESDRLYQLDDERHSQKEISDIICREFNRETLDRSTIRRHLKNRAALGSPLPNASQFCDRGYHSWIVETIVSTTTIANTSGDGAAGYMLNTGTKRTCRECGWVEETTIAVGDNERVVTPRPRTGRPAPYVGERP